MATTEAQKRATKKWREKNKEKQQRYNLKSNTKKFIKTYANIEELKEITKLIAERKTKLNNNL